jgi:hypothetical protein
MTASLRLPVHSSTAAPIIASVAVAVTYVDQTQRLANQVQFR